MDINQEVDDRIQTDRSVDLSMISSDILEGIEVYKAITPDMDADAVGGSINLVTRTADPGFHGRAQLETGYHGHVNGIGTYKGSVSLGKIIRTSVDTL